MKHEIKAENKLIEKPEWTNDKVIDFVNWYIHLHRIDDRFELENQNIIDSFLNGDDYKLWWHKAQDKPESNGLFERQMNIQEILAEYITSDAYDTMSAIRDIENVYHNQFKREVTDEEINKEAVRRATTNTYFIREPERAWFEKGAKWMRDQLKNK